MFFLFWGPRPARLAAAMLRGSQVCSALRWLRQLGLAFGHPSAALGLRRLRRLLNPLKAQLLPIS
ncbi:hypothetical protein SGRA_3184 [Saprospira grandis str. Lewin]|uniref:Uncharacterized protein n=1 Tax=Saprospira grandis (strain Lewin) TaxID=984262 RepID=H6L0V6_SAPGL|nr:hypothetical protein SGRA_3184 [Saprospira grandis str. Lewin]